MQIDERPGVILTATPAIDPAHPGAASLTIQTATERPRYYLRREILEDLGRQIALELWQAPLEEKVNRPSVAGPYDLKRQTHPRVRAEAGRVVVRLELTSLRDLSDVLDIEVLYAPDIASTLGFELLEAAKKLA